VQIKNIKMQNRNHCSDCKKIEELKEWNNLSSLTLDNCNKIEVLKEWKNLSSLTLDNCNKIEELKDSLSSVVKLYDGYEKYDEFDCDFLVYEREKPIYIYCSFLLYLLIFVSIFVGLIRLMV
jgi:hypothetical protein